MPRREKKTPALAEVVNKDMLLAEQWGKPKSQRPARSPGHQRMRDRALGEFNMTQLAQVRVGTRLGDGGLPPCTKISRSTGQPCKNPQVKGLGVCWQHAGQKEWVEIKRRRVAKGEPPDKPHKVARKNMKMAMKKNLIPRELMLNPLFQSVMSYVAPRWFGKSMDQKKDRVLMKDAALLSREMVLAWDTGTRDGDWTPWGRVVNKLMTTPFAPRV